MDKYLRFFAIPIAVVAVLFLVTGVTMIVKNDSNERTNTVWTDSRRVFDYADKLTDSDERTLTNLIYELEQKTHTDMAVVILNENLTEYAQSKKNLLPYQVIPRNYLMIYTDDFSFDHGLGWNGVNGDAIVFSDNWNREADGNLYSWVSTSGRHIEGIESYKCSSITSSNLRELDDDAVSSQILEAYSAVMTDLAMEAGGMAPFDWYWPLVAGVIAALIFFLCNFRSKLGNVTVGKSTYVEKGSLHFTQKSDMFTHKTVSKVPIPKSSGSGGGGGGHVSSGGGSFGGGGSFR